MLHVQIHGLFVLENVLHWYYPPKGYKYLQEIVSAIYLSGLTK